MPTPGRPREFDEAAVLTGAMERFWTQGYDATSMSDLLAATGLSKSSLYQAFHNKRGLFIACLKHYTERLEAEMLAGVAGAASGEAFLTAVTRAIARDAGTPAGRRGCLVMNTASELGQTDVEIAPHVADAIERFVAVYAAALADCCTEDGRDPLVVGRYLLTCLAGLKTLVKSGATADEADAVAQMILASIFTSSNVREC